MRDKRFPSLKRRPVDERPRRPYFSKHFWLFLMLTGIGMTGVLLLEPGSFGWWVGAAHLAGAMCLRYAGRMAQQAPERESDLMRRRKQRGRRMPDSRDGPGETR